MVEIIILTSEGQEPRRLGELGMMPVGTGNDTSCDQHRHRRQDFFQLPTVNVPRGFHILYAICSAQVPQ